MKNICYLPIVVVISTLGCVNRDAQKQAKVTEKILSDPVQLIEIYEAKPEKFAENLHVKGTVVAPQDTNISSKIAGKVTQVFVKEGEKVKANQVLAVLETDELRDSLKGAESQVKSAFAALEKAKINVKMSIPKNDAAIKSAYAQLSAAKTALKKAKVGGREQEKSQAQAAINAAKSSLDIAAKKSERYKKLYEAEAVSLQDLEDVQNAYQLALTQYEQAKDSFSMSLGAREEDIQTAEQQVIVAEQSLKSALIARKLDDVAYQDVNAAESAYRFAISQRSLAMRALENTIIRAPFGGTISGKSISPGTVVSPGIPMMRLTSDGNYYIEAEISEQDYRTLNIGGQCEIKVPALSQQTFKGSLAGINPNLEEVGRLLIARINFSDNVKGLIPGMFTEAQIALKGHGEVWLVPAEAVMSDPKGNYVFVSVNNTAVRKDIRVIKRLKNRMEISGISLGDRVVVKGQNHLAAGMKVKEQ